MLQRSLPNEILAKQQEASQIKLNDLAAVHLVVTTVYCIRVHYSDVDYFLFSRKMRFH